MLLVRILTAIAGIPLVFVCVHWSDISFYIMMFITSFSCVQECLTILKKYNPHIIVSLLMAIIFFLFLRFFKDFPLDKTAFSAVVMIFVLFGIEIFNKNPYMRVGRIAMSFLMPFFIPLSLIHMVYIHNSNGGMKLVFFLFIVVWVLDTAAYAFGSMVGKHKLAQNVSPNKTIEGAVAGVIFAIFAAIACRHIFMKDTLMSSQASVLGFVIAVTGQLSDLAQSIIKRDGNIKDSGKIIPGHGGVFDRFDSYIFAAPTVYYVLQISR